MTFSLLVIKGLGTITRAADTPATDSEVNRLQKLEDTVRQLQQRNAELEQEFKSLKNADCIDAEGWCRETNKNEGRFRRYYKGIALRFCAQSLHNRHVSVVRL